MPLPKFNFVPERQIGKSVSPVYRVSIYPNMTLVFPSEVVKVYELNGKFVRFYADMEKKALGWSVVEGDTNLEMLDDARKLKANSHGGVCTVSIKKLLGVLGITKVDDSHKKMLVQTYKSLLNEHEIYYIEFNKENESTKDQI